MRAIRAAVFASVCVVLAALGHVLMSGAGVPWWSLAVGLLATGGAGWCLAGRERGLLLIVSVVVAAQGGLHGVFELAQPSGNSGQDMGAMPGGADPMGMSSMGGAHMGAGTMASGTMGSGTMGSGTMGAGTMGSDPTGSGAMGGMSHDMAGMSSFGMLAAHTLAALLCGLWLAHGERAAFRILRAVAGWLAAPLNLPLAPPAPAHPPRPVPRRARSERAPRLLPLVHTITSRGPPAGTAVV
ncbi:hypothetical protein SZN_09773 [Streptomyces zinciresistens K42]|uniref:Integral-membrane protein n=1 Tax=Streptomyces zinciresistens K42 TaxID=700597 RepID=G2G8Y6_9ACTN|nr:hypothetical protein SZN_09773 [Streptomyces zinciresistens K42]